MVTAVQVCDKCQGTGRYLFQHTGANGGHFEKQYYCDLCPQGPVAEREDFPAQYPKCTNDPPTGLDVQCGNEHCNLHNIRWLEIDGCSHEQAIGLTAVYNFSESWGYGPVADALGGMVQFNELNENGADVAGMVAWYDQHQPLVYYILETHEKFSLWDYWWQAKHPQHPVPERGTVHIHLVQGPSGELVPYHTPGFPLVVPDEWDDWVAHYDATKASMDPELWATHTVGHFEWSKTDFNHL